MFMPRGWHRAAAHNRILEEPAMAKARSLVGLDVHATKIVAAVLDAETGQFQTFVKDGDIARAAGLGRPVRVAYEAGPTGYGLARALARRRVECVVAAPSKIPRASRDRVKTDRRDAEHLVRLLLAGKLHPVRVPGAEEEALHDLVRAREAVRMDLMRSCHLEIDEECCDIRPRNESVHERAGLGVDDAADGLATGALRVRAHQQPALDQRGALPGAIKGFGLPGVAGHQMRIQRDAQQHGRRGPVIRACAQMREPCRFAMAGRLRPFGELARRLGHIVLARPGIIRHRPDLSRPPHHHRRS
jgi:Transposase